MYVMSPTPAIITPAMTTAIMSLTAAGPHGQHPALRPRDNQRPRPVPPVGKPGRAGRSLVGVVGTTSSISVRHRGHRGCRSKSASLYAQPRHMQRWPQGASTTSLVRVRSLTHTTQGWCVASCVLSCVVSWSAAPVAPWFRTGATGLATSASWCPSCARNCRIRSSCAWI